MTRLLIFLFLFISSSHVYSQYDISFYNSSTVTKITCKGCDIQKEVFWGLTITGGRNPDIAFYAPVKVTTRGTLITLEDAYDHIRTIRLSDLNGYNYMPTFLDAINSFNYNIELPECTNGESIVFNGTSWVCNPIPIFDGTTVIGAGTPGDSLRVDTSLIATKTDLLNVPNLYRANGTVTGDREVELDGYSIGFEGGNMGIGTHVPAQRLHVNSGTPNDVALFESSDLGAYISFYDGTGTAATDYTAIGSIGDNLVFRTADLEKMRLTDAGNLGIGTTTPTEKIEIDGNAIFKTTSSSSRYIYLGDLSAQTTSNQGLNIYTKNTGDSKIQSYNTAARMDFTIGNLDQTRLTMYGRAHATSPNGVEFITGTPSSDTPLGNIIFTASDARSSNTVNVNGANVEFNAGAGVLGLGNYGNIILNKNGGNVGIGLTNPATNALEVAGTGISSASGFCYTLGVTGETPIGSWSNVGGINRFSGGSITVPDTRDFEFFNGTNVVMHLDMFTEEVGIGTASPSGTFHVVDNALNQTIIESTTAGTILQLRSPTATSIESDNILAFNTTAAGKDILFRTNYTTAMRINEATSNVGIGTTSAISRLHVVGGGSTTGKSLFVENSLGDDNFTILDNGDVGIGITSPQANLHVKGAGVIRAESTANPYVQARYTGGAYTKIQALSTGGYVGTENAYDFNIITSNSPKITVKDDTGNVGVGTISPTEKFHLFDNASVGMLFQSNSQAVLQAQSANSTPNSLFLFKTSRGNVTTPTNLLTGNNLGSIRWDAYRGSGDYGQSASIDVIAAQDFTGGSLGSTMQFKTTKTSFGGRNTHMEIYGSGQIKFNEYGSGLRTGTLSKYLGVDSDGDVIEVDGSSMPNIYTADGAISETRNVNVTGNYINFQQSGGYGQNKVLWFESTGGWSSAWLGRFATTTKRGIFFGGDATSGTSDSTLVIDTRRNTVMINGMLNTSNNHRLSVNNVDDFNHFGIRRGTDDLEITLNSEGDAVFRSESGMYTFGLINTSVASQNPSSPLHMFGPVGVGSSTLMKLEKQGGYGVSDFHRYYEAGTFNRGLLLLDQDSDTLISTQEQGTNSVGILTGNPLQDFHVEGNSYFNGNVGIGTSTPTQKLHIKGTTALLDGDGNNAYLTVSSGSTTKSANLYFGNSASRFSYTLLPTTNDFQIASLNGGTPVSFYAEYGTGNVGIGTAAPSTKLTVAGEQNIVSTQENILTLDGTNTYPTLKIASTGVQAGRHSAISFRDGSTQKAVIALDVDKSLLSFGVNSVNDDYLVVTSNGNVGIGTTTPAYPLDIVGGFRSQGYFTASNPDDNALITTFTHNGSGNAFRFTGNATNSSEFRINNNSAATTVNINSAGNTYFNGGSVGIGTTTPADKLHINGGNLRVQSSAPRLYLLDDSGATTHNLSEWSMAAGNMNFQTRTATGDFVSTDYQMIKNASGASIQRWFIGASEIFRIHSNSNFAIGNDNPSQKLHVTGNARITGAIYDSNNEPGTSGQLLSSTVTGTDWIDPSSFTGWAAYNDGAYTVGSPLAIAAGITTTVPNNAATTLDPQKPIDITTFYNSADTTITGRDGDGLSVVVEFKVKPTSAANTRITTAIDIGGATPIEIFKRDFVLAKGNGVEHYYSSSFSAYNGATWETNGGKVKVTANGGPIEIYDIRFVLTRTHKAR